MTDLLRTIDDDAGEASSEEEAPVLTIGRAAKALRGLASDDDDVAVIEGKAISAIKERAGHDFDVKQEAKGATAEREDGPTSLELKIRGRLEEKDQGMEERKVAEDEDGIEPDNTEARALRWKTMQKQQQSQPIAEHLRTDMHFADLRLSRPLLRAISDLKYKSPTPIQRDVIPPALRGLDILATAETGSGKTASFLLPALERLCQSPSVRARRRDAAGNVITGHVATKTMVLIPTRELAAQCHSMLQDLAKYTMVSHQLVVGGFASGDQARSLRLQPDLVVATPGRLLDHLLNSHSVHMELLEIIIFDEADRLLEMGFKEECTQVLKRCAKGRQTMLFSATLNASVEDLASLALVKPVRVHANVVGRVAETLEQEFVKVPSEKVREAVLLSLCDRNYRSNVIIFCKTKRDAHRLAIIFGLSGLKFAEIHGNLLQIDRMKSLQRFQEQQVDYLVATDVAARGLDLCNVETVINFHIPSDAARYVHRCGRTARMGRVGRAVTLYCPEEYSKVKTLGKRCCTKVASTVLKRTVAAGTVQEWSKKIDGFEEDIAAIVGDESVERELRMADMLSAKGENLQKHRKEIAARPENKWIMTNAEKEKLRSQDLERVKDNEAQLEAGGGEEPKRNHAPAPEGGKKKKKGRKRKNPFEGMNSEEKRAARVKADYMAKKKEKQKERASDEAKARAARRRSKAASKHEKGKNKSLPL